MLVDHVDSRFCVIGLLADCFITFFLLVVTRVVMITVYHYFIHSVSTSRDQVLIYMNGAENNVLTSSLISKLGRYQVAGYISLDRDASIRIAGYRLFSAKSYEEFTEVVQTRCIKYILFTKQSDVLNEQDRLVRYCTKAKVRMLMLPSMDELKNGKLVNRRIPELRIEDLLGRDEIHINMKEVVSEFAGKVVLVTGAAGSIGSELCRQLAQMEVKQLVLFDSAETPLHNLRLELEKKFPKLDFVPVIGDVRIEKRLRILFEKYHPQVVFHAAAYKHVPLVEHNPSEGVRNNVFGTLVAAQAAHDNGVSDFVLISTDKAVRPTNIMGASKRLAEMALQALAAQGGSTKFTMVRFGNVLGSSGSVVPLFRRQIRDGGPVTLTHPEITRYFMTIPEAAQLVIQAGAMARGGDVFVLDMGEPVRIIDLARRMIELSGLEVRDARNPDGDIEIAVTGLRPGEKLYEELLIGDNPKPTSHPRIMKAHEDFLPWAQLEEKLAALRLALDTNDVGVLRRLLEQLVSGYAPSGEIVDWVYLANEAESASAS